MNTKTPEELYDRITGNAGAFQITKLGEDMEVFSQSIAGWWKPRYLVDRRNRRARQIMDTRQIFTHFTADDIDWTTLESLPADAIDRARRLSAHFPTRVNRFKDGLAEIEWQINPDGMYYRDEDGFGMTDDIEITLCGVIDRGMNVVRKFRYGG